MIENPDEVWDYTRPNPSYFEHIENTIARLGTMGIQADLILFHPYDRWGYSPHESGAAELLFKIRCQPFQRIPQCLVGYGK